MNRKCYFERKRDFNIRSEGIHTPDHELEHDTRENENDGKFKDVRQACNVCNKAIA